MVKETLEEGLLALPDGFSGELDVELGRGPQDHVNFIKCDLHRLRHELIPGNINLNFLYVPVDHLDWCTEEAQTDTLNCILLEGDIVLDDLPVPLVDDYVF